MWNNVSTEILASKNKEKKKKNNLNSKAFFSYSVCSIFLLRNQLEIH